MHSDDPQLRAVWLGIRRTSGTAVDQAAPLTVALLRQTIDALPLGLAGTQDRALLLAGFAVALRHSEPLRTTHLGNQPGEVPIAVDIARSIDQLAAPA